MSMGKVSKLCIICHQWSSPPGEEQPPLSHHHIIPDPEANLEEEEESLTKVEEKMKIFFALLISHLNLYEDKSEDGGCGAEGGIHELLERAIKGGMLLCGECLQTVDGFVKLYRQLKAVEGRLNSKLRKLTNVMFHAQTGTSRINGFREAATKKLNVEEEVADKLVILKRRIVRKGRKLLRAAKSSQLPEEKPLKKLNPEGLREPISKDPTYSKVKGRRPSVKSRSRHVKTPPSSTSTVITEAVQEPQPPAPPHHRQGSEEEWLLADSPPYVKNEKESENEDEAFNIFHGEGEDYGGACEEADPEKAVEVEEAVTPTSPASPSPSGTPDITDVSESDDDDDDGPGDAKVGGDDKDCYFIIQSSSAASIKGPPPSSACMDPKTQLYKCHLCPLQLKNRFALRTHLQVEHMQIKFGCSKCLKEFTRKSAFQRHYNHLHLGVRNFRCDKCSRTFTRKCYLEAHQPHLCDGILSKRPTVARKARAKQLAMTKEPSLDNQVHREYRCRRCQQVFKSFGEHRRHVKEAHPKSEEGPAVCEICGKVFQTSERLGFHMSTVHCKTKKFVCEFCGVEFSRRDNLNNHRKRVHLKNKIRKPRAPRAPRNRKKVVKDSTGKGAHQKPGTNDKGSAPTPTEK